MNLNEIENIYFIGIGGIGMSAIARYFNALGKNVAGYDRTPTQLTTELQNEGMAVHFTDSIDQIPTAFTDRDNTLVIFTPAIPPDHVELGYFMDEEFTIKKRSQVLGLIIENKKGIAVAGTHGKTTVSTMISYLLNTTGYKCSAFLGGISKNYKTNYLVSAESDTVVVEADEFDRSFLQLHPWLAVITAMDADHLDIYGDKNEVENSFNQFVSQLTPGGFLIHKYGLPIKNNLDITTYTYSLNNKKSDFYATDITLINGTYSFNINTPFGQVQNVNSNLRGLVNVENSVAAIAVCTILEINKDNIAKSFASFEGIWRRFDYQVNTPELVFIDDYAHHPEELRATINSVKEIYKDKKITGVFQPHLYSRTKDFADGFAESLSLLDEVILLDIYPAREEPIPGVTSEIIYNNINTVKTLITKKELLKTIKQRNLEVLITLGAGDIDKEVEPIKKYLLSKK